MARGLDEPFTLYGLVAETVEVPPDRSSVTFHLDPAARFSDGKPITADDVIFSMETLRERGRPNHRTLRTRRSCEPSACRIARYASCSMPAATARCR